MMIHLFSWALISQISWTEFTIAVLILLPIYYAFVGATMFKEEIGDFIKNGSLMKKKPPVLSSSSVAKGVSVIGTVNEQEEDFFPQPPAPFTAPKEAPIDPAESQEEVLSQKEKQLMEAVENGEEDEPLLPQEAAEEAEGDKKGNATLFAKGHDGIDSRFFLSLVKGGLSSLPEGVRSQPAIEALHREIQAVKAAASEKAASEGENNTSEDIFSETTRLVVSDHYVREESYTQEEEDSEHSRTVFHNAI